MTRRRVIREVQEAVAINDVDPLHLIELTIDATLDHMLEFVQEFSAELITHDLYAGSLVLGVIATKMKHLKSGDTR